MATHNYTTHIEWTGNSGEGTKTYKGYERTWDIDIQGKPIIHCSNDPLLGGDPSLPNPEDLLLSSLSACHMLWYLHLACNAGITVLAYEDEPMATGELMSDGSGRFIEAILKPKVTISSDSDSERAQAIHTEIHKYCFISRSVSFPVRYDPTIVQ